MKISILPSQKVGNKLLDALMEGKPEKIETLLSENCEVHIPFPKKKKIKLKGKKQSMDYFISNFVAPIPEIKEERNLITSGYKRAIIYTKAQNPDKDVGALTDYCGYFKIEKEKIIELFLLIKCYE